VTGRWDQANTGPGRYPVILNHSFGVMAGLVPAIPSIRAQSNQNRGGRDKPGHDPGEMAMVQYDRKPLVVHRFHETNHIEHRIHHPRTSS